MEKSSAKVLIQETFKNKFNKEQYRKFVINLLDDLDENNVFTCGNAYVPDSFKSHITSYGRIGKYTDKLGEDIEVLWVNLRKETSLDRARTIQRNFVAWYLNGGRGAVIRNNALVAFYNEDQNDWRFSFVKLNIALKQDENSGKVKVINEFTPAKRYSYLVGELEPNHTAQSRLVEILAKDYPTVNEIEEAFNVEKVSKEFFANYKELFLQLVDDLKAIRGNDDRINYEFTLKSIKESDFCKKLLGQLVFLYFIQKKGWLGVPRDAKWGQGDKQFLRHTFERAIKEGKNFFNDYLEPLFYNALANGERDNNYFELLDCKIPFLNGGLFETIGGYDWVNTDIVLENEIFSNSEKAKNGDIGTGILDVFDRYNFTVKEDEPLEKEVAVDPEMLGKVFEELLEIEDRKSKGAFYTPREIVHYMCQESLINYLVTELGATEEETIDVKDSKQISLIEQESKQLDFSNILTKQAIADFIHHSDKLSQSEFIASEKDNKNSKYQHKVHPAIIDNAKLIDQALENIKICDPAIGSGAFPVGMLNEIVRARIALVESGFLRETKKRSIYEYKRQAIQNSIYGVDIEPGAVEIAKLRLWLSLVVDEEDIENIKALPNLDYKIVCGNSLLNVERNIFNDSLFTRLEELKPQFFNETRKSEKRRLKKEIDAIIEELTKDGIFDFEIYFSEVFNEKGGFDIVIGNPPYIGQKGNKDLFEPMKKHPAFEKKMDYWYFFLHEAYNVLNNKGINSFITPNYWITAQGGKRLRNKFVNDFRIIEVINFNQNNIFTAGVHTNVFILSKFKKDNNTFDYCLFNNNYDNNFIENKKNELNFKIKQENIYSSWSGFVNFLPDYVLNITNKLIKGSEKLSDNESSGSITSGQVAGKKITDGICNINQGIITGKDRIIDKKKNINNGIYVLNKQELNKLSLLEVEKQYIKDFYKNSDIKKYFINSNNKNFLLYVNHIETEVEFKKLNNLYYHLLNCKDILKDRFINGVLSSAYKKGKWWALTHDKPFVAQNKHTIVCPQRSSKNTFAYADENFYSASDIFYISQNKINVNLKYILSILNSKVVYFWLYWQGKRKGEVLELTFEPLQYIPIKKADEDIQKKFVSVVDKILAITQTEDYLQNTEKQNTVKEYEKQIDIMVYKLYELTYDEVLTIDKDFTLSEQQYNDYQL